MKTYPTELVSSGEVATEREWNAEMRDIGEHANALDFENFQSLTGAKLALGAIQRLLYDPITAVESVTLPYFEEAAFTDFIPNASGTPWSRSYASRGGILSLSLRAAWRDNTVLPKNPYVWIGLRVDGELVARSADAAPQSGGDSALISTHLQIGPGTHVIDCIYGVSLPAIANVSSYALTWEWWDRALVVLERLQ